MEHKIILGPPGCGKTTECIRLVEEAINSGTRPSRIAYFSFTKKAAQEASDRACARFDMTRQDFPYFRTLHSLAYQQLGLIPQRVLGSDQFREIGALLGLEFTRYYHNEDGMMPLGSKTGDQILWLIGMANARIVPLKDQWNLANIPDLDWFRVKQFNDTLAAYKRDTYTVDFSDMLNLALDCPPLDIDIAIIDEAQDLSRQQWRLANHLVSRAKMVYIAGDDDQAIHAWAGADVETFLTLQGTKTVLEQSYRLPRKIHALCDRIVSRIHHRYPKKWHPRDVDGRINRINTLDTMPWEDGTYMVLARNKYLLKDTEELLRLNGLPYISSGKSSIDPDHIRAIQTWEQLRQNQWVTGEEARNVYDHLRVGPGVQRGYKSLKMVQDDQMVNADYLYQYGGLVAKGIWHDVLTGIPDDQIQFYLAVRRRGEKLLETPRIQLSTIHGVKGGEADHVVLISDMSWRTYNEFQTGDTHDDEHRVAFVGASRAKQSLTILSPQTPRYYDF